MKPKKIPNDLNQLDSPFQIRKSVERVKNIKRAIELTTDKVIKSFGRGWLGDLFDLCLDAYIEKMESA
jgi:hypothetical protein